MVSHLYKWWGLHAAEALGCRQFVCDLWLSHAPLPPPFLCFSPKTEHNFSRNPTLDPVLSPVLPCTEEKGRKVGGREEELRSTSLPAAVALSCPRFQHFRGAAWEVLSLSILSGSFQLQFLSKSRWTATHQQLGCYLRWPVTVAEEKKERMMFLQNLVPGCSKEFEVLTTPFDGRMIRGKLANFLVEQVINKKGEFYHPS